MARHPENSAIRSVHTEIAVTIAKAARNGRVVSVAREAARIAQEYPDCELTNPKSARRCSGRRSSID